MSSFKTFYIDNGNAVQIEEKEALPTREDLVRERIEEKERRLHARILEHRKNKRESRRNTIFVALGVAVFGGLFVVYVTLQNSIATKLDNISSLENQVSNLKAENSATENRISTMNNLSDIKEKAINELGMVYETDDNIIYYEMDGDDYVKVYDEVK